MPKEHTQLLFEALARCRRNELQSFADAWVGMEPTFSNAKAIKKWAKAATKGHAGEDAYFEDEWMLNKLRDVGREFKKRYKAGRKRGDPACIFPEFELEMDRDPWDVQRLNFKFSSGKKRDPTFEVRFGMDPETFEYSIKPVPLAWFHDDDFVRFLQKFVWDVPLELGLVASMAHGGGQFSTSAKTWLQGTLLADDITSKLNHPELSTWITDYPNGDDRALRATRRRFEAYRKVIAQYWSGAFHPEAIGGVRVENALLDTGFLPAAAPPAGLMDASKGPKGDARTVFQNNFVFARAVRHLAQAVQPGYWQAQHPDEDGYRPDQIMRYSEGNLNRLQLAGELHVKSGKVLDLDEVPEFDAPVDLSMLYDEASWENRGQMSRTSAEDFVEAVLLDTHHGQWLLEHPHVQVKDALAQDAILMDAEQTLSKFAPSTLAQLKEQARADNLESSRQRIKSDFIEPETLFWAAWKVIPAGQQAEIAREAIGGFLERVERAASKDPRGKWSDPMEPHRHRVQPILWDALLADAAALDKHPSLKREAKQWQANRQYYIGKRPIWSPTGAPAPWEHET